MSALKYLVLVLIVETVRTRPSLPSERVRRNLQPYPSYLYPAPNPYYQPYPLLPPPRPYPIQQQQQQLETQQSQEQHQPLVPIYQQAYPVYVNPPFNHRPIYQPSFQNFPQPPYYPSYPFQQNYPNYPSDPFAHIPTDIIDVDGDGGIGSELTWEDLLSKLEVTSNQQSFTSEHARPVVSNTQIIESKPIRTTITRTFDSGSSEPVVDVTYTDPDSKGSGTLIEAEGNLVSGGDENVKDDKVEEGGEKKTEEDESNEKTNSLFSWG